MQRRNTLLTTNALVSAILIAALLVALNYLGSEHHLRWDLTATREHSLSPQTIKVLRSLPGPVEAVAFPNADTASSYRQFLTIYRYYSKDFQFRVVDPDRNPAEAQKFKITSYGQIVLTRGKTSYTVDSDTEEQLTNGLLHLLQTAKKVVYVLQGEGEVPLDDFTRNGMGTVKQALTGKGFDVKALLLVQTGQVPDDANAVVIPSPTRDFLPQERDALDRYFANGGKLLILIDPQTSAGIRAWLETTFHVAAPGGVVIDPVSRLLGGDPRVPIVTQYPFNDITQNFNVATAFPLSTPLAPQPKAQGVTVTPVVKSSDASYVKVNLDTENLRFEPGTDVKGPATLAVEVTPAPGTPATAPKKPDATPKASGPQTPTPAAPKGSAVIFGNSGFIRNTYIGLVGNRDLFTSAVAWLTQSGNLVSIAPRTSPFDAFIIGGTQGRYLFLGSVIVLPLALLLLGGTVYFRRRSL
ncbi:MAG TPA: Gldg family protein [bacterium]|nr:Gldg family protein [bacterium]